LRALARKSRIESSSSARRIFAILGPTLENRHCDGILQASGKNPLNAL
jgi:hypothetical protein